ncbi:MAG: hypothetical protein N4A37_11605 [Prolixibacteraceae bacterium]|jgi:hypothetical protein|nr:hypothetical protein [Prolixibacteraceae bacterium]
MEKQLIKEINNLINECYRNERIGPRLSGESELRSKAYDRAISIECIEKTSPTSKIYKLTELGYSIYEKGGMEIYLKNKDVEKKLDDRIQKLTYKHLEWSIIKIKFWWIFMILGALITFFIPKIFSIICTLSERIH